MSDRFILNLKSKGLDKYQSAYQITLNKTFNEICGKTYSKTLNTTTANLVLKNNVLCENVGMTSDYSTQQTTMGSNDKCMFITDKGNIACYDPSDSELYVIYDGDHCASLESNRDGSRLAIGFSDGDIMVYDFESQKSKFLYTKYTNISRRIKWVNDNVLSSTIGSYIRLHDIRSGSVIKVAKGNKYQLCSMTWSLDGRYLTSGSDHGTVCVWDSRKLEMPLWKLKGHTSSVGSVDWCPWNTGMFATGGIFDKSIKIWDVRTGDSKHTIQTNAQVCSILFSRHTRQIISAHGYGHHGELDQLGTPIAGSLMMHSWGNLDKGIVVEKDTCRYMAVHVSRNGNDVITIQPDAKLLVNIKYWKLNVKSNRPKRKQKIKNKKSWK